MVLTYIMNKDSKTLPEIDLNFQDSLYSTVIILLRPILQLEDDSFIILHKEHK